MVTATELEIHPAAGSPLVWPLGELRQTQGRYAGEPVRLERAGGTGEAVIVPDAAILSALRQHAPAATRRHLHDPARRRTRVVLTALAAAGSLALAAALYEWGIPAAAMLLARLVPVSWEVRLGEQMFERALPPASRCRDATRQAVLDAILARLVAAAGATPYWFTATVIRDAEVNAFALPGGRIAVLHGLLVESATPEMLAGTLAHEIQHIARRHATREILQAASVGALVGVLVGDPTGAAAVGLAGAQGVAELRYSRQYEAEADREAMRLLLAARVDPQGHVAFLERLVALEGPAESRAVEPPGLSRYLVTHPGSEERLAEARAIARTAPAAPLPLVPGADWADVKRICHG